MSELDRDWEELGKSKLTQYEIAKFYAIGAKQPSHPSAHLTFFDMAHHLPENIVRERIDAMSNKEVVRHMFNLEPFDRPDNGKPESTAAAYGSYNVGLFLERVSKDPSYFATRRLAERIRYNLEAAATMRNVMPPSVTPHTIAHVHTGAALLDCMVGELEERGVNTRRITSSEKLPAVRKAIRRELANMAIGLRAFDFPTLVLTALAGALYSDFLLPRLFRLWGMFTLIKKAAV